MNYEEFRKEYEQQHPSSVPKLKKEISPYPRWTRWGVFLMFLSAALLSGVHTIPVTYNGIPGGSLISDDARRIAAHSSFIAVELAILFSAFVMLVKNNLRLAYIVIGVCFVIAIIANITSISETFQNGTILDIGGVFVSFAFGVGMPLVALMAGKLFVNIHQTERRLDHDAQERLDKAQKAFDKEILKAWKASNQPSKEPSNRQPDESSKTVKPIDASQRVIDYLRENPADIDGLSSGRLASKLGVSKATANNVQRKMKGDGNGVYLNGHDNSGILQ